MAGDTVMEEREEIMVSPISGEDEHYRNAHFLKPSAAAAAAAFPSAASSCKGFPVKVKFPAWGCRSPKWKTWVYQMRSSHDSTWKRAGILDAIISTTYFIPRCEDLISGLTEKWSPTTNSFVFPWGEVSITLEDMVALAAYSVLGDPVFTPPTPGDADMENKLTKLLDYRIEMYNSPVKKACLSRWMAKFMGSGSEIEHEAFLAFWLSKFVFPFFSSSIGRAVIPIAIQLARGTRISLAPPVLASIYRALTLLKEGDVKKKRKLVVSAPLALVQVWAWERLPLLRPNPKKVGENEPRIARWVGSHRAIRSFTTIDSVGENIEFRWRPYTSGCDGMFMEMVENEESFVRCVRVSKLVGLEKGYVEQYLPYRVAMQFGMDQDLPGHVALDKVDPEIAWSDYVRPAGDVKIYVPPRTYQPCVTRSYFEWWKKLKGMAAAAITEQLEDDMDVDADVDVDVVESQRPVMRRCTSAYNAKSAFGVRGCFRISKRMYLQQFRRQRNVEFASEPQSHSSATASASKSSGKSSEKSNQCPEKSWSSADCIQKSSEKSPQSLQKSSRKSHDSSQKSHECSKWIPDSSETSMSVSSKASEPGGGCEIEGNHKEEVEENRLFSAPSIENVVKLSELATVERAEEKIDIEGLGEKVRIVEEILRLIKAGNMACHIPQNHRKKQS